MLPELRTPVVDVCVPLIDHILSTRNNTTFKMCPSAGEDDGGPRRGNGNDSNRPTSLQWTADRLCRASYQDIEKSETALIGRFKDHLLKKCRPGIYSLLVHSSQTTRDFSLEVDAFDLLEADPVLGHVLLKYPTSVLRFLEDAIVEAQDELKKQLVNGSVEWDTVGGMNKDVGIEMIVKGFKGNRNEKGMTRVHARIVHLPPTCCRTSVATMEASDIGRIVQVSGTCVRASPVQMYESARQYKCTGKNGCSRTFLHKADMESRNNSIVAPLRCPECTESGTPCKGTNLQLVEGGSIQTDYQEIKIQEAASKLGVGSIPRSLLIKLQHDLVDRVQPGDEVVVVGILLAQWQNRALQPGLEPSVGMALEAHSIRVVQENGGSAWQQTSGNDTDVQMEKYKKEFADYWKDKEARRSFEISMRDKICQAVCPKLYGLNVIKLALLITLIGGVSSESYEQSGEQDEGNNTSFGVDHSGYSFNENQRPEPFRPTQVAQDPTKGSAYGGHTISNTSSRRTDRNANTVQTRRRDMSHLLLVGDPGTGKSQILRFAAALCPRSVLTTGVGTTSAGLTCAAVREGNDREFALEAGALVLADKGVCCIDEFGCIRNEDRTTIHEAMEQQTLSVAKAGIVCKLNCRATVIAVMNPRDSIYDNFASLAANTGLGTPLLSRFDLIFKLVDSSDAERDHNVTAYLMNRAIQGFGYENSAFPRGHDDGPWSMEKLRAYISIVKDKFRPKLDFQAAKLLECHYEKVRSAQSSVIPVTVRFLESLIRLTQSHARLCYRNTAGLLDAVCVIRLMESSAYVYGGFEGIYYQDPMALEDGDPDLSYAIFEYNLLSRYGMLDDAPQERIAKARTVLESSWNYPGGPNVQQPSQGSDQDHYGRQYPTTQPTPPEKRRRFGR